MPKIRSYMESELCWVHEWSYSGEICHHRHTSHSPIFLFHFYLDIIASASDHDYLHHRLEVCSSSIFYPNSSALVAYKTLKNRKAVAVVAKGIGHFNKTSPVVCVTDEITVKPDGTLIDIYRSSASSLGLHQAYLNPKACPFLCRGSEL